jgi:hypothetical protein
MLRVWDSRRLGWRRCGRLRCGESRGLSDGRLGRGESREEGEIRSGVRKEMGRKQGGEREGTAIRREGEQREEWEDRWRTQDLGLALRDRSIAWSDTAPSSARAFSRGKRTLRRGRGKSKSDSSKATSGEKRTKAIRAAGRMSPPRGRDHGTRRRT